jgi:hypothetical protein
MALYSDILESRAFRRASTLEKYSVQQLSEILFLHLLTLEVLSHSGDVRQYAKETMAYPTFDGIRFSATDLSNLISTLKNADRYLDERSPSMPFLELKRYIRGIEKRDNEPAFVRLIYYKLQTMLKVKNSQINVLRRDISEYNKLSYPEQVHSVRLLYQLLRKTSYNSDLINKLHNFLEKLDN